MHTIHPYLLRRTIKVAVVGCGGTGSAIVGGLPHLHQALIAGGHPSGLAVTVIDGDRISAANCVRQPFSASEIGLFKSVVLINRLNLFWGLDWQAVPQHLATGHDLHNDLDLVIGCVDSRAARAKIHEAVTATWCGIGYWLDIGNSADTGQFVLGQPLNRANKHKAYRLRAVSELFPEIIDPALDDDSQPSCSAAEALERQHPFINQTLANHSLALLSRLFRCEPLSYHGGFLNLASGALVALRAEPRVWNEFAADCSGLLSPNSYPRPHPAVTICKNTFSLPGSRSPGPSFSIQTQQEKDTMSETSTLIGYAGRTINREELALVPTPPATATHQPVPHHQIVQALVETLGFRHIGVVHDEYAVSSDGMKMFGVLDLETEMHGARFSIGLRNSHDKTMRLALTCGYRVFVCSNMAFSGDFTPVLAKHSKSLNLVDSISVGVDRMQRNFAPMQKQVESWQSMELSNVSAKMIVYEAFIESELEVPKHLARRVHDFYFEPQYEEFRPRTLWSLSNAFTSAFKELDPIPQFKATAKLGAFLEERLARKF